MAKRGRKNQKWQEIQDEDLGKDKVSLGDLFKDLASQHPELELKETGRLDTTPRADEFSTDGKKSGNKVTLWHGTTEHRAGAIISQGFVSSNGWIWMTPRHNYARSHAMCRAQGTREGAVLFRCVVDLSEYSDFARHGPHFSFRCNSISRHVIRKIFRLETGRKKDDQKAVITLIDIPIAKDSGKQEVLSWINECMKLMDEKAVRESHPAVAALLKWIKAQYINGRNDPITEEEMLIQMSAVSINQASRHFGVGTNAIESWIDKRRIKVKSLRECPVIPLHLQNVLNDKNQNVIKLWYGTTEDQAREIVEEGFKKSGVRFTKKLSEARSSAIKRAKQRSDTPVVISCEIDLGKHPSFGRSGNAYTFYIPTGKGAVGGVVIGKEVVQDVSVVEDGAPKHSREKTDEREAIDVVVTRTSGKLGVLWWINRYLELEGKTAVGEDHPAVEAVFRWVDAQYSEGRDDPISDEEMRTQVGQFSL
ncbi:hypothetical protein ACFL6S_32925 [Candidatus Poribacteria bacterium]